MLEVKSSSSVKLVRPAPSLLHSIPLISRLSLYHYSAPRNGPCYRSISLDTHRYCRTDDYVMKWALFAHRTNAFARIEFFILAHIIIQYCCYWTAFADWNHWVKCLHVLINNRMPQRNVARKCLVWLEVFLWERKFCVFLVKMQAGIPGLIKRLGRLPPGAKGHWGNDLKRRTCLC